jgi:hypothetical protein
MNAEEKFILEAKIARLIFIGEGFARRLEEALQEKRISESSGAANDSLRYEVRAWLSEVSALMSTDFKANSGLIAWCTTLADSFKSLDDKESQNSVPKVGDYEDSEPFRLSRQAIQSGIALLRLASTFLFVDAREPASDPLRLVIEDTVKEKYFASWPFRFVLLVFGAVTAAFLGGTIYLDLKTKGALAAAEEMSAALKNAKGEIDTAKNEMRSEIQNAKGEIGTAKIDMRSEIQNAITRIETKADIDVKEQLDLLNAKLKESKDELVSKSKELKEAFQSGTEEINGLKLVLASRAAAAIEKVVTDQNITKLLADRLSTAVESAKEQIPEEITKRLDHFNNTIARYSEAATKVSTFGRMQNKAESLQEMANLYVIGFWTMIVSTILATVAFFIFVFLVISRIRKHL